MTGERVERNEGVGLVLDPNMAESWRECGEVWSAVSSRIVTARLRSCEKAVARSSRGRSGPVCERVYAPTHRACQAEGQVVC